MTLALGTPQRGQTMAPEVERLAMEIFLKYLDCRADEKDSYRRLLISPTISAGNGASKNNG